ncbi:MAG: replication protein P [Candidatus Nitrosocosmicus sp.]
MKKIGDVAQNVDFKSTSTRSDYTLTQADANFINELFKQITGICNAHRWTWQEQQSFENSKKEWAKAFIDAGIRDSRQVEHGLKKLRLRKTDPNGRGIAAFIPSVGDFIDWCTPKAEDLGLPDVEQAYLETIRNYAALKHEPQKRVWTHPVVEHAARNAGSHFLINSPRKESYETFCYNYSVSVKQFVNGEIKEISKAIGHDVNKEAEKREAVIKPEHKNVRNATDAFKAMRNILP